MKIGDKLICIKKYNDNDYEYDVEFKKNQIYSIHDICDEHIRITGEVKYHTTRNLTYICHGFSIIYENKKKFPNDLYLKDHFINLKEYRKQKLLKINENR